MSETSLYEPPIYNPPRAAAVIGTILRAPRNVRHTGNFSYVFSPDREEQLDYVDGLMVVSSIFLLTWVIWAFALIILKFKGKEVGCASGRAFVTIRPEDEEYDENNKGEHGSTSDSSGYLSSRNPLYVGSEGQHQGRKRHDGTEILPCATDPYEDEKSEAQNSAWMSEYSNNYGEEDMDESIAPKINPRENRTRFCFVVFASVALICVPLILAVSFAPIKEATESSEELILNIRDTMDQVEASLNSIESASMSALEIVDNTPTDLGVVCPLIDELEFEALLGIDLRGIIQAVSEEYDRLKDEVRTQLSLGNMIVDSVENGISDFEASISKTEENMWIIPALLFVISVLSAISILGVVLAWKEKSGIRFQRSMSYGVLPLLILVSIACWMVVVVSSFGSMIGTDMCMSSSSAGSPDQTIQEIMSLHNLGANDTAYQVASAYTNRCIGPDPTKHIDSLEDGIQDHIDNIWRQMSKIDSLGRAQVIKKCGGNETFNDMLSGARNLAKLLTAIRRSLSTTEDSLKCSLINPIYAQVAHETICNSALKGSVYGFILFLIVSICVMVMISLRASWLRHIEEEKVYHDEDEVAENMILDEHEEYLAYISRYKHEWQEYGGFEEEGVVGSDGEYVDDETDEGSDYRGECSYDESDVRSGLSETDSGLMEYLKEPTSYRIDGAIDGTIQPFDEISFPSLSSQRSEESQTRIHTEEPLSSSFLLESLPPPPPPPPPPPAVNPEFSFSKQDRAKGKSRKKNASSSSKHNGTVSHSNGQDQTETDQLSPDEGFEAMLSC